MQSLSLINVYDMWIEDIPLHFQRRMIDDASNKKSPVIGVFADVFRHMEITLKMYKWTTIYIANGKMHFALQHKPYIAFSIQPNAVSQIIPI